MKRLRFAFQSSMTVRLSMFPRAAGLALRRYSMPLLGTHAPAHPLSDPETFPRGAAARSESALSTALRRGVACVRFWVKGKEAEEEEEEGIAHGDAGTHRVREGKGSIHLRRRRRESRGT